MTKYCRQFLINEVHVLGEKLWTKHRRKLVRTLLTFSTNGVGMVLYYDALEYVEEIEEEQYTFESLLSSLGGTAGLLLGCR